MPQMIPNPFRDPLADAVARVGSAYFSGPTPDQIAERQSMARYRDAMADNAAAEAQVNRNKAGAGAGLGTGLAPLLKGASPEIAAALPAIVTALMQGGEIDETGNFLRTIIANSGGSKDAVTMAMAGAGSPLQDDESLTLADQIAKLAAAEAADTGRTQITANAAVAGDRIRADASRYGADQSAAASRYGADRDFAADIERLSFDKAKPIEVTGGASLMTPAGGVLGTAPDVSSKTASERTPMDVGGTDMDAIGNAVDDRAADVGGALTPKDRAQLVTRAAGLYQQTRNLPAALEQAWREVMGDAPTTSGGWLPFTDAMIEPSVPAPQPAAGAIPAPEARQAGAVYQTPKGPMKWTGTGWLPAT